MTNEEIKYLTNQLYDQLPLDEEERKSRLDIRDKVFKLNQSFFGYVATHTFINNKYIEYADKYQAACLAFCKMWYKYRWEGHYRTDLSFAVFFKPRIGEELERELNEVKYSVRRTLCMEVGAQLGKHWGQVRYEDLNKVNLPADKMNALKAMFGSLYDTDIDTYEPFLESQLEVDSPFDDPTDKYDTIEDMLIHEMIIEESKLSDKKLKQLSDMLNIDIDELIAARPVAEETLHKRLLNQLAISDEFK